MFQYASKSQLYNNLHAYEKAGIPILQSLSRVNIPKYKNTFEQIHNGISRGNTLSLEFEKRPELFTPLERELITIGEDAGILDQSFLRLSTWFELMNKTKNDILTGIAYPVLLLHIAAFLLNIPVFIDAGGKVFCMNVISYLVPLYGLFGFFGFALPFLRKNIKGLAFVWDRFVLKIPVIGKAIYKLQMARFAGSMSCCLEAGVNVIKSLDISSEICTNLAMQKKFKQLTPHLQQGNLFSQAFAQIHIKDPLVLDFIQVGESSGTLDEGLKKVEEFYYSDFRTSLERISKLLPPIVMLIIGLAIAIKIVGFYAKAIH